MTDLIKHITNKDYESANKALEENFKVILEGKLHEMKKMCAATMEQNTHDERQKRLKKDVIEEIVDEGRLLHIGKKKMKIKSPVARANASERPAMSNIKEEELEEAKKTYIVKHKKSKEVHSTHSSYEEAKAAKNKIDDKSSYGIFEKVHKDSSLANRTSGPSPIQREDVELNEARVNIVKLRVRGGQVQRRQKVSNVPGMTLRGGKLTRMSPAERRRRKLGAKKAARKAKTKKYQALRKRKMSLLKRSRLGG
jgi:hypothetical protein